MSPPSSPGASFRDARTELGGVAPNLSEVALLKKSEKRRRKGPLERVHGETLAHGLHRT